MVWVRVSPDAEPGCCRLPREPKRYPLPLKLFAPDIQGANSFNGSKQPRWLMIAHLLGLRALECEISGLPYVRERGSFSRGN